jgi:hypothetical protein
MTFYAVVLVFKFLGVLGYAGGLIAAFVSADPAERKRAAHRIASPCLLLTWFAGYFLVALRGPRLFELWVVGGLVLSLASHLVLVTSVARGRRDARAFVGAVSPLVGVVILMASKLTWSALLR